MSEPALAFAVPALVATTSLDQRPRTCFQTAAGVAREPAAPPTGAVLATVRPQNRRERQRADPPAPRPGPADAQVTDLDEQPESLPQLFAELACLFRQRLADDPGNVDVRFKLLELCHRVSDAEIFMTEMLVLDKLIEDPDDPRRALIQAWGRDLMPDHPLFLPTRPCTTLEDGDGVPPAAATGRAITRHYDSLSYRRAQPALETLRKNYIARRENLMTAVHAMASSLDARGELRDWHDGTRHDNGARIICRHGDDSPFHPVQFNARAQVAIATQMGFQHIVTGARSIRHARAVAWGVEQGPPELRCEIVIDPVLADGDPEFANWLNSERVTVVIPAAEPQPGHFDADARVVALNKMLAAPRSTYYLCDLGGGPTPYSQIIRDIQTVSGRSVRDQLRAHGAGEMPAAIVTCTESGQSGISLLLSFLDSESTSMFCAEAPADAVNWASQTTIDMRARREHAWLRSSNRVEYCIDPNPDTVDRLRHSAPGHTAWAGEGNSRALALAESIAAALPADAHVLVQLAGGG